MLKDLTGMEKNRRMTDMFKYIFTMVCHPIFFSIPVIISPCPA